MALKEMVGASLILNLGHSDKVKRCNYGSRQ
jgi:hypothetical protein